MKTRVNHEWHDEWLIKNIHGFQSYTEAAIAYKQEFGIDISVPAIKNHCRYKLGLRKTRTDNYRHISEEQAIWLADIYPKVGVLKATKLWNERYHDNASASCIKQIASKVHATVDPNVAVLNKLQRAHGKGSKRAVKSPGETRIECGRLIMKGDDGIWKSAGRCVWEKDHGKIPDGYAVVALDGDTFNIDPANFEIVPWNYLGKLSRNNLFSSNPDITRAGILLCDLETCLEATEKPNISFIQKGD